MNHATENADPFEAAYPNRYGAAIEITRAGGEQLRFVAEDCLGDPARPLSEAAIVEKARALMNAAGTPSEVIDATIAATLDLADGGAIDALSANLA